MAAKNGATVNWSVLIAAGALILAITSNVLNVISGGTEKLEKRVSKLEDDVAWKYVSKELALKDFNLIDRAITELKTNKVDKDIYEQKSTSVDRQLGLIRDQVREIDKSVNQTFSSKDALTSFQTRILELERAARSSDGRRDK